ncbi:MAG: isocitrate/isopropylmalate dehydrogenase family protein [Proteobacteria bacterium]|nr:isocitrate/isopropylmalate dehydrogenase family protein [Pseudomonadota bacterium]
MSHIITLIPGDGTGPELVTEARRCIEATGVAIDWEVVDAGTEVYEKIGVPLPREAIDSIEKNRIVLKGPVTTPAGTGYRSVNVQIRQHFDLFACVRPCKTIRGFKCSVENADLVIIRENTEDLYAGIEFRESEEITHHLIEFIKKSLHKDIPYDSGITIKSISRSATQRITEFAFHYAGENNRKKVTVVTKANIMKFTDGLFFEEAQQCASNYPQIEIEHLLIDNLCYQLVSDPRKFDILLAPNLYGDIISDLCAALVGGLGIVPSANIGKDCAMFEAVHGSAPQYKGQNLMNPCALTLAGVMLLRYIGEPTAADCLQNAVEEVLREGRYVTRDLNPHAHVGTREMADRIIYYLKGGRCS